MCRFVFYGGPTISLGSLLTEPEHSLINQSIHAREREEPLNGDGFGVAWYAPELRAEPVVFKEVNPAWNSLNLRSLAPVTRSGCILAHVRAASPGLAVTQLNCHPFARGRFAFMHNGVVAAFRHVRRSLLASLSDDQFALLESSGDSEILFALALDRLAATDDPPAADALGDALIAAIEAVERAAINVDGSEPAYLNLVLTDGRVAAITRYVTPGARAQSLYLHVGSRYECAAGVCRMVADDDALDHAVLVASEPLTPDPGWRAVPENTLLLIGPDRTVGHAAIEPVRRLA